MEPIVAAVADGYRSVHDQMRNEIRGLGTEELNWTPAPETNSIATLVVHTVGSEGEIWRTVRGVPSDRDRPSEFRTRIASADDLLPLLDAADALLDELAPAVTAADLATVRPRPPREPQTGLTWLVTNYGHAREHLAHLQLTKQLYANHASRSAGAVSS